MRLKNEPMVGIYGKSGVEKSPVMMNLIDFWCEDS
jgi:hypothetical protein